MRMDSIEITNNIFMFKRIIRSLRSEDNYEDRIQYDHELQAFMHIYTQALKAFEQLNSERLAAIRFHNTLMRKAEKHPDKAKAFKYRQKAYGVRETIERLWPSWISKDVVRWEE